MGKVLMSGNEAVARGAWEAGVEVATAYPGTQLYKDHEEAILSQYGSLDAYFSVLGDADHLTFNFTEFSDEKLLELKAQTEQTLKHTRRFVRIYNNIRIYGPILYAKKYLRKIRASS